MTASTADAIIPFDFFPVRFEEAVAVLLAILDDDATFVDFGVLDPMLLADEPDFPAFDRELELVDLVRDEDDPALADVEPVPLRVLEVLDFADAADPDLEPDALLAVPFFAAELDEDLFVEPEVVDLELEDDLDRDPDDEDFDFDAGDFDVPDFEADDFEELDLEVEDFLVVAMIFLRVIE